MQNNLVPHDSFCDPLPYQKAGSTGNSRYPERAKELCPALLPDQECIDEAVKQGHELILEFIENALDKSILPTEQAVDVAAKDGELEILQEVPYIETLSH